MFAYLQGTRVGRLDVETYRQRKDLGQIFPQVMWTPTISFCCRYTRAHVPIHSCKFTNGYSQGQGMDRTPLYRIPKEIVTSRAILVSRLSIYGTMGAGAEAKNSVLQNSLVGKEEHKARDNTERVQPLAHDTTREASGILSRTSN